MEKSWFILLTFFFAFQMTLKVTFGQGYMWWVELLLENYTFETCNNVLKV